MFADSHVAWFRGSGFIETNYFQKVELWASKFSGNIADIIPYKLLDVDIQYNAFSYVSLTGGQGRVMFAGGGGETPDGKPIPQNMKVVDVASKKVFLIEVPEKTYIVLANGLTRTHAWFSVEHEQGYYPPRHLIRWKLPPLEAPL